MAGGGIGGLPGTIPGSGGKKSKPKPKAPKWGKAGPGSLFGADKNQKLDRASKLHGITPKQIQKLLSARGYDIPVDGKMGEKTKTAMDAYIKGKPAKQYNDWASRHFAPKPGGNLVSGILNDAIRVTKGKT